MNDVLTAGQIHLTRKSETYWRVAFDFPAVNIFARPIFRRSKRRFPRSKRTTASRCWCLTAAVEEFLITHFEFVAKPEKSAKFPVGRAGLQPLPDMLVRLSRAPVVSTAMIRGRTTGVGSEVALACDFTRASQMAD